MLIYNARVLTEDGAPATWLQWQGRTITALGSGQPPQDPQVINAGGHTLLAGFIDLHVHGGMGADVMDATPEALHVMATFAAQHGTTAFLPTTLTDTHENLLKALDNIKRVMQAGTTGATILGAHVEGPYLNADKCGAQNPRHIRRYCRDEGRDIFAREIVRLITVAPEFPQNHALVRDAVAAGVRVSVAHSAATAAQLQTGIALGIRHSTHTFNAQTPFHHRDVGIVGVVMGDDSITAELISDGIHVHPLAMRALWRCKRPHQLVLVTDAVRPTGMPDGSYSFGERTVLLKDGVVRLPDGTLAGSAITMARALEVFAHAVQEPLEAVWQTTSLNAARALGIDGQKGSLAVGKDADLVLLDEVFRAVLTVVEGRIVHQVL